MCNLVRRLVRGYLVLRVGPRDMSEKPAARSLRLKGAAGYAGSRFGIDEALLQLKWFVITKMQAAYPQDRCARGDSQQLTALGIVLEFSAFEQSITVGAAATRYEIGDVPDLEDRALQGALGDDGADTATPLNQAFGGQGLYCSPHRHA